MMCLPYSESWDVSDFIKVKPYWSVTCPSENSSRHTAHTGTELLVLAVSTFPPFARQSLDRRGWYFLVPSRLIANKVCCCNESWKEKQSTFTWHSVLFYPNTFCKTTILFTVANTALLLYTQHKLGIGLFSVYYIKNVSL